MKILSAIKKASELLKSNGIITSKLDSEILISKVLGTFPSETRELLRSSAL